MKDYAISSQLRIHSGFQGKEFHHVMGTVSQEGNQMAQVYWDSPPWPLCWWLLLSIYFLSSFLKPAECSQRALCHPVCLFSHRPRRLNLKPRLPPLYQPGLLGSLSLKFLPTALLPSCVLKLPFFLVPSVYRMILPQFYWKTIKAIQHDITELTFSLLKSVSWSSDLFQRKKGFFSLQSLILYLC